MVGWSVLTGLLLAFVFWYIPSKTHHNEDPPTRKELLELRGKIWAAQESGVQDPIGAVAKELRAGSTTHPSHPMQDLLHLYAEYRDRAKAFAALPLAQRLQALKKLRREVFGEALAKSLFGEDERMAEFVVRRGEILKDTNLSAEDKKVREERLKKEIFGDNSEDAFPTDWFQYYEKTAREMAQNLELTPTEREKTLDSLREGLFGKEAADRLKKVELEQKTREVREEAVWKGLESIEAESALAPEDRAKRLGELQGEMPADEWDRLVSRFKLHGSSQSPALPQ